MNSDVKELVIARLDCLPANIRVSTGHGTLTKADMIRNVEDETPIGEKLAGIQIAYIKSLIKNR